MYIYMYVSSRPLPKDKMEHDIEGYMYLNLSKGVPVQNGQ